MDGHRRSGHPSDHGPKACGTHPSDMGQRRAGVRPPITDHARRQCESRDIDVELVIDIVKTRVTDQFMSDPTDNPTDSCAVRVARYAETRGGLIGSNGDEAWAIMRDARIVTVMFRRSNQPATPSALRVRVVII
jgi:hypothetical protein